MNRQSSLTRALCPLGNVNFTMGVPWMSVAIDPSGFSMNLGFNTSKFKPLHSPKYVVSNTASPAVALPSVALAPASAASCSNTRRRDISSTYVGSAGIAAIRSPSSCMPRSDKPVALRTAASLAAASSPLNSNPGGFGR